MKAMILAAGYGTRLLPYTNFRPKPLFPILGRPLLKIIIDRLRQSGFSSIVVNTFHLGDQIVDFLKDERGVFIQEEKTILGTGGGLRMALDAFAGEPVLVVNGDLYSNIDYSHVYEQHIATQNQITMVMHDYERFNKVKVGINGMIAEFSGTKEALTAEEELLAFTGVHVVNSEIIAAIPPGKFTNIIDRYSNFIKNGGIVHSMKTNNLIWRDIGTPSDYLELHCSLLKDTHGIKHLTPVSQSQFYADDKVEFGENVILSDWGMIGAGAKIEDGVHLERVVVWDGAVVEKGSIHKDTIVC